MIYNYRNYSKFCIAKPSAMQDFLNCLQKITSHLATAREQSNYTLKQLKSSEKSWVKNILTMQKALII